MVNGFHPVIVAFSVSLHVIVDLLVGQSIDHSVGFRDRKASQPVKRTILRWSSMWTFHCQSFDPDSLV